MSHPSAAKWRGYPAGAFVAPETGGGTTRVSVRLPGAWAEHRIFNEEDISVAVGVHSIEAELERTSERFVRLGVFTAKKSVDETVLGNKLLGLGPSYLIRTLKIGYHTRFGVKSPDRNS
jgi:hypothetical protein